jgi:hypothetical protein
LIYIKVRQTRWTLIDILHPLGAQRCSMAKSNARKRSGDNENAILWTPLLTLFGKMDMWAPKRLGFLLYGGEGSKRDLRVS